MARQTKYEEQIMDCSRPESQPSCFEDDTGLLSHAAFAADTRSRHGTSQRVRPRPLALPLNHLQNGNLAVRSPGLSEPDSPTYQKRADAATLNFSFDRAQPENDALNTNLRQNPLLRIKGGGKQLQTLAEVVFFSDPMCSTPGKSPTSEMLTLAPSSMNLRIRQWLDECHEANLVSLADNVQSRTLGLSNHRASEEVRSPVSPENWFPFVDFEGSYFADEEVLKITPSFEQPCPRAATPSITPFSEKYVFPNRPQTRTSDASTCSHSTHPGIQEVFAFFQNLSVEEVLERRERDAESLRRELAIYDLALPQRQVQLKNRTLSPSPPPSPTLKKAKRRPRPLNIQLSPLLTLSTQRLPRFNEENPREPEVNEHMLSLAEALAATEIHSPSETATLRKSHAPRRSRSVNLRASSLFSQSMSVVNGLRKSISSPLHAIPRRFSAALSLRRSSKLGEEGDDASDFSSTVSSVVEILHSSSRWSISTTDDIAESPLKRTWGSFRRRTMSP